MAGLGALAPAAASGHDPKHQRAHIQGVPTISGTPRAGELLTGHAQWSPPDAQVSWQWLRCRDTEDVHDCQAIAGATASSYRAADADVGRYLRVYLRVTESSGDDSSSAWGYSAPTDAIGARPVPTPVPTPTPTPVPTPTPTPSTGGVLAGHAHHRLRLMHPRPVVRIRGWLTADGARVTLLTVRAPRGARVRVRCHGASCPRHRWAHTAILLHVVPFERRLRAGTRLVITVTKRGYIGKHTVLRLRRGRPPARVDRCLYPGARVRRCPAT